MKYYFSANHVNNDAGGYRYLVTRAFCGTELISRSKVAGSAEEAKWHMQSFVQYYAMNEKQRKQQAAITASLFDGSMLSNLFDKTRVLPYNALKQHYGKSRKDALWNTLPIPTVQNISGIAYINPLQVLRFMFVFGVKLDNFVLRLEEEGSEDEEMCDSEDMVIINVEDCKASRVMTRHCRKEYSGKGYNIMIIVPLTDWLDGFGSNRTKQNRKPIRLWTWNASPPRETVNTVSNTFPIAIGMKKNSNWNQVEQQF
jgi:hypothetical protein